MSQLIAITSAQALTKEAREELRKDVEDQLKGCDVRVLFLAPGLMLQHMPPLPFLSPLPKVDAGELPSGFLAACGTDPALATREVQHVDTDEQEEPAGVLPPHVWLYRNMLTPLQALAPMGKDDTNGQFAVACDDLSPEQATIPHVESQLRAIGWKFFPLSYNTQ